MSFGNKELRSEFGLENILIFDEIRKNFSLCEKL